MALDGNIGKITIIHRDQTLIGPLAEMATSLNWKPTNKLVNPATTAQEVASFVLQEDPNLVLLAETYQEPLIVPKNSRSLGGQGIEALIEIRRAGYSKPVFMMSGSPEYRTEAEQARANGYLEIPTTLAEFSEFLAPYIQS